MFSPPSLEELMTLLSDTSDSVAVKRSSWPFHLHLVSSAPRLSSLCWMNWTLP